MRLKEMRMMWQDILLQAMDELVQANDVNKTVNGSQHAAIMERAIRATRDSVAHSIKFAEDLNYPDVTFVAIDDSEMAVIEHAIVEFAWNVMQNFGPDQHFRVKVDEFVNEWSQTDWRVYVPQGKVN
jgi:hypothetical protein